MNNLPLLLAKLRKRKIERPIHGLPPWHLESAPDPLCIEAADEIERLLAENEKLTEERDQWRDPALYNLAMDTCIKLQAVLKKRIDGEDR